jgi:hypothetical protein
MKNNFINFHFTCPGEKMRNISFHFNSFEDEMKLFHLTNFSNEMQSSQVYLQENKKKQCNPWNFLIKKSNSRVFLEFVYLFSPDTPTHHEETHTTQHADLRQDPFWQDHRPRG